MPPTSVTVTKRSVAKVKGTRPVAFRITIRNTGNAVARDVVVTDRIPAGLSLLRLPKGATIKNGVLTWRIGDLAPGQVIRIGYWTRADPGRTGRVCNTARAVAGNAALAAGSTCVRILKVKGASFRPPVTG